MNFYRYKIMPLGNAIEAYKLLGLAILSILLFTKPGISQPPTHELHHPTYIKSFINQMQRIENRTTAIDRLSFDEKSKLRLDSHNLHNELVDTIGLDNNLGSQMDCVEAAEALTNFIDNSIKNSIHARQDWEDYKDKKQYCLTKPH